MENDRTGTLVIRRFCGEEYYPLQSGTWSIWDGRVFCVEMDFGEGTCLHEDTEYLAQEPLWELYFDMPSPEVEVGTIFTDEQNREDETHLYYCEHYPTEKNRVEVLERDGERMLLKITGECCDVNYYDGSKGNDELEITVWLDKE